MLCIIWIRYTIFNSQRDIPAITGYIKYTYDNLRRLTGSKPYLSITLNGFEYAYDPVGNRTSRKQGKTTITYTYNKPNNHLTSDGTNSYAYDDNGNLSSITPPSEIDYYYTWDYENRLTKIKKAGSGKNDSLLLTYCGLGKRIKKVHTGDPDTTRYGYDGMYAVVEFGDTDTLTSKYVYANGLLLGRYDASGVKYYYHHDGLGSTIGITDASKAVAISYLYDDFGKVIDKTGNISNRYMYTGQEYDSDIANIEQYNLRARYYNFDYGRFISEDPNKNSFSTNPQNTNNYVYSNNNSINWIDPAGEFCITSTHRGITSLSSNKSTAGQWNFKGITLGTFMGEFSGGFRSEIIQNTGARPIYCVWDRDLTITSTFITPIFNTVECWHDCFGYSSSTKIMGNELITCSEQYKESYHLLIPMDEFPLSSVKGYPVPMDPFDKEWCNNLLQRLTGKSENNIQ